MMDYNCWGQRELIEELQKRDLEKADYSNCLRLHRDDFRSVGFDASMLSKSEMQSIASDIGNACMESFWYAIEFKASEWKLPKFTK